MSITSMSARARMAENLSIQQLQQSIQDGVIPSYIGVPLLQEKVNDAKLLQQAKAAQNGMQQPSVAQQIMSEANQVEHGIPALPTNLPQQGMAGGGIVAFSEGGMYDDEDDTDEDRQDAARRAEMEDLFEEYAKNLESGIGQLPVGGIGPKKEEGIATGDVSDFVSKILHKESRGRRYGKDGELLTSEKGAKGEMQVMPGTSRDPGFGVKPARNDSPDELARVGRDYAEALLSRYRDPKLAAIAYNMGPGATDKWLSAGADVSKLPKETQGYVQGFAKGGDVKGFAGGGFNPVTGEYEDDEDFVREGFFSHLGKALGIGDASKGEAAVNRMPGIENARALLAAELAKRNAPAAVPAANVTRGRPTMGNDPRLYGGLQKEEANQDATDAMDNSRIDAMLANYKPNATQSTGETAKVDPYAKFEEMFARREANLEKQREQDKYMAMIQAGLSTMAGRSPNALQNIGAGASQGLQSLAQSNAQRTAEENALLAGRLNLAKIGSTKDYQDQLMQLRKDIAGQTNARLKQAAESSGDAKAAALLERKDAKTYKLLSDIEDKIRAGVAKDIAGNVLLQNKPNIEQIKEQMVQDRLRAHKTYGRKYQEYFGEPAFDDVGGGTKMSSDRAAQFKVER